MFEKVRDMLAYQLDFEADKITPDSDIIDDLNADSLDIVEFISDLETEFGITIPQEEIDGIRTVGQIAEIIEKNMD